MNKILAWIAGTTKIGKVVKGAQSALDGKKQTIAALITALTGTATILANFAAEDGGLPYLLEIAKTPEFLAASGGWIAFFNSMKGEKIRHDIAEIKGEPAK